MFALLWHYKQQAQPHADLRDSQASCIFIADDSQLPTYTYHFFLHRFTYKRVLQNLMGDFQRFEILYATDSGSASNAQVILHYSRRVPSPTLSMPTPLNAGTLVFHICDS
jgi:hypothetical protein